MVTEPRPSRDSFLGRSPPKRWEEDLKVLIHWGMPTMRSRTGGSAGIPDASDKQARVFGKTCSVRGEPLLAYLSGDRAPKGLAAKVGCKTTTKGRKTLATTHVDKVQWHGWTQQAIRQKPNKSAHVYEFLLRAVNTYRTLNLNSKSRQRLLMFLCSAVREGRLPQL